MQVTRDVVAALCAEADIPFTLVMKSTAAVGTGKGLIERFLSRASVPITYVSNPELLREGRAVSGWGEFSALDWSRVRGVMEEPAIVFDGRNCLDADAVRAAGMTYMAVGRPGAHRIDSKLRG